METNFTFNGVTSDQFEAAINTVCAYFNGIAATPLTEEMHPTMILTGVQGMILDSAHRNFINKLREYGDSLQKEREKIEADKVSPLNN